MCTTDVLFWCAFHSLWLAKPLCSQLGRGQWKKLVCLTFQVKPSRFMEGSLHSFSVNKLTGCRPAFPQLKEISFKITITSEGGVSINCRYYSIFSKLLCLLFWQFPSPYHDSHMQINCGSPDADMPWCRTKSKQSARRINFHLYILRSIVVSFWQIKTHKWSTQKGTLIPTNTCCSKSHRSLIICQIAVYLNVNNYYHFYNTYWIKKCG